MDLAAGVKWNSGTGDVSVFHSHLVLAKKILSVPKNLVPAEKFPPVPNLLQKQILINLISSTAQQPLRRGSYPQSQ